MKQYFPILPAIFGQKCLTLVCYTMANFVIQKTDILNRGLYVFYIKRKISLSIKKNYCVYLQS